MRRTNIYLNEPQLTSLKRVSERRGEPVAYLVRQAVDEWLTAQGVKVLDEDEWGSRFDALLASRREVASRIKPDEADVEREVAAAVREARQLRANAAARRR